MTLSAKLCFSIGCSRIFVASAESINPVPDVSSHSWFVEDISLTTTTLRHAKTNEVSTVNNWSIAGSRIVNCARSSNATVHLTFLAGTKIFEGNHWKAFQNSIHRYVEEHPRVWDSIRHIRHDQFDADGEKVEIALALRHRCSWQEAGRIKLDRANVYRFLYELGLELGIHFEKPADKAVVYEGGSLRNGGTEDCSMKELLKGSNILSKAGG